MSLIKLLLVDDNLVIRKSFKNLLATIHYIDIVGECSDGEEVLPFLNKNKVDVVFMDIVMEVMDGFEATQKVKHSFPDVKIIGFSPNNDASFIERMMSCGADGFISKFDADKEWVISELHRVGFVFR